MSWTVIYLSVLRRGMIPIWRNRESSEKATWGPVVMISMEDGEDCKRTVMLRMVSPIDLSLEGGSTTK